MRFAITGKLISKCTAGEVEKFLKEGVEIIVKGINLKKFSAQIFVEEFINIDDELREERNHKQRTARFLKKISNIVKKCSIDQTSHFLNYIHSEGVSENENG